MIIKLEDSDITTAQDDSEDRGVIHVPDDTWNHIIKEVEHQDQQWVNSLYIDVGTLSIGGSGLPIVIYGISLGSDYLFNTWDMNLKEAGTPLQLQIQAGYAIVFITEYNDRNAVNIFYNSTGSTATKTLITDYNVRYFVSSAVILSNPQCRLYDSNSNEVLYFNDSSVSDQNSTIVNLKKQYIDFLWINN